MERVIQEVFQYKRKKFKGTFIVAGYQKRTEDFIVSLKDGENLPIMGAFQNGLSNEENESLHATIVANQSNSDEEVLRISPGICVELCFDSIKNNKLINPTFKSFKLDTKWDECKIETLIINNLPNGDEIDLTSLNKFYWETVTKEDYISYLVRISPYILPFLTSKQLTLIRFPDGVDKEAFYQKNCPDYAPDFIKTNSYDDIDYIICNDIQTLVWLGNQGALEFHIPFNTIHSNKPNEIVFDLDPPDEETFDLVILAANEINNILTSLDVVSFPKLTGSKGIQIHIPIHDLELSYEDTRNFTSSISNYIVERNPEFFTVERLKRNRKGRLYIDYLQHAEGKTMISPYSTRGKSSPTVAAPLLWEEVTDDLKPNYFTIHTVLDRIKNIQCPFSKYFSTNNSSLLQVIENLKNT